MRYRVTNETQQRPLADRVERADRPLARMRGLLGRQALAMGEGLHIVPCTSIHTFFMQFAIDALFLSTDGRVVRVYAALPPWRTSAILLSAHSVLELPAGTVAASGTREGDRLQFEPVPHNALP